jgi:tRNA threonylcarbamoyladenosine biosynthesis protein TsaE
MQYDKPKKTIALYLSGENATLACGVNFAKQLNSGLVIYLHGDLGAGKTTFVRGVLQGLGFAGKVKSPTYALLETYHINVNQSVSYNIYHFDLYRFADEEEWEVTGFREYFNAQTICFIEWPEKAQHLLPIADINILLSMQAAGRMIQLNANTHVGEKLLKGFDV